jgi:hypothetical protein
MRSLLEFLVEQPSVVAIGLAAILLVITLILRYAFDLWWPWGIGIATILGLVG